MRRIPFLLVLGLAVAGCGQSDDRLAVRTVTRSFLTDYAGHRGQAACATLSPDTRAELVKNEGKACALAIGGLQVGGGRITEVDVRITNAKVDLSSGESVFLGKTALGWRLSAIGCKPKNGPPSRYPLDCELQA